jgi:hypothetical protein
LVELSAAGSSLSIPIPGRRQQLGLTQASTPPARQLIFLEGDGRTRTEATGSVTTELPVGPSLLVGPVAGPSVATRQRDHRQAPPEGSRAAHRGGLLRRLALEVLLDVERRCGRGRHMGDERTSRPALVAPACPGIVRNRSARARNPGVTLLHETTAPCAVTVRREIACGSALSRGRDLGEPHARGGT